MKKLVIFLIVICILPEAATSQGVNNMWLLGYENPSGPPWGGLNMDFSSGLPALNTVQRKMNFFDTNANIADSNGNLLFSSNGIFVANATGDTMVNGSGLNPGFFADWYSAFPGGFTIPQANLIIPYPGNDSLYYLFHSTVDTFVTNQFHAAAMYLYYSVIDISQDSGRGAVASKNNIIITDTLNLGKITATKHANGRDWWVVCHKMFSKRFYKLLVTPYGIDGPYWQDIGMIRGSDGGQVCFSPDGSRFAYYHSVYGNQGAQLFNFNRCSGMFSQPYVLNVTDSAEWACGVAFSPNSDFLYVSTGFKVYQFDCSASNINATKYLVAEWDSFYSPPGPPFATTFYTSQLAPDGKIYISSTNSVMFLHVINQSDSAGQACDLVQHGLQLPVFNGIGSVPNHPNYFLGALTGSVCDSLTGVNDPVPLQSLQVYPNPAQDFFSVSYLLPQNQEGTLYLVDVHGRKVYSQRLPEFATFQKINTKEIAAGIYYCIVTSKEFRYSTKVVLVK